MIRLMSSTGLSIGASVAAKTRFTSAISSLTDFIPTGALAKPLGLRFATMDTDVTVSYVGFHSTTNEENRYTVYKGATVALATLEEELKPNQAGNPFSIHAFDPQHGLELVIDVEVSVGAYNPVIVWKLANAMSARIAANNVATPGFINSGAGGQMQALPLINKNVFPSQLGPLSGAFPE